MSKRLWFPFEKPLASQFTTPSGVVCIQVYVPDALEHLYLLQGLMAAPTKPQFWDGTEAEQIALAEIWQHAYEISDWRNALTPGQMFYSQMYIWGAYFTKITGSAIAWNDNSAQPLSGYWRQSPAAINDEQEAHFALPRGIYRIDLFGLKSSICGQQQITWNGNAFPAVIDWYNATTIASQLVQPGYDITLTDDNGLTINSKMTGKNASATDYQLLMSWLKIRRTGDV